VAPDPSDEPDPVDPGQPFVGEHQVHVVAFEELHRLLSTPRDEHVVSFDLQGALERAQEDLVVLDDQDPVSHRPLLYATSATAGNGDRGMIRRIVVPPDRKIFFFSTIRTRCRITPSSTPLPRRPAAATAECSGGSWSPRTGRFSSSR